MTETSPSTPEQPEGQNAAPEKVERPVGDIGVERAEQQAAVATSQAEALNADERQAQLGEFLMEAYQTPEGEQLLAEFIDHAGFPDKAAQLLHELEAKYRSRKPEFDIISMPLKRVAVLLEKKLVIETDKGEAETKDNAVTEVEAKKDDYATLKDRLEADPEWQQLSNADKVNRLLAMDEVPPEAKAKFAGFKRILDIAKRNEADFQLISARFESEDVFTSNPQSFLHTYVFSSPDQDSGVSHETQVAMAEAFGVDPRSIVTGSDYTAAMAETKPGPDGEPVPAFTEDDPLTFRPGLDGYTSDDGQTEYMTATTNFGQPWTLNVTSLSPAEKGRAANLLELWAMTEDAGETEYLISLTKIDLSATNAVDPFELRDAAKVLHHTLGGFAGYDGEIFYGPDHLGMIRWQAQLRSPKGDAARSDRNADMTDDALRGLGIRDADGRIDFDVLDAFGRYSRDNWFGVPDYDAVQAHLANLFPDKFPDSDRTETDPIGEE